MEVRRARVRGRDLIVRALAATCYSRLALLERELDDPLPDVHTPIELELGLLDPADLADYLALVPDATSDGVLGRLAHGDQCFTARREQTLVGVSWAAARDVHIWYLHGALRLRDGEALIDGGYVAPAWRGRNVATALGAFRLAWLREAGLTKVLALILPENSAAFGPPLKLGYRRSGVVRALGVGPLRRLVIARSD
jgi:GNAT superfamily N-acetyltransferase